MGLTRCCGPSGQTGWEVDGSGLTVFRVLAEKYWRIGFRRNLGQQVMLAQSYLNSEGLSRVRTSTRAAAVDAVRLTLAKRAFIAPVTTRWVRQEDGGYLSHDGNWRLVRAGMCDALQPASEKTKKAVESYPGECARLLIGERLTLRAGAIRADQLNRMIHSLRGSDLLSHSSLPRERT